MSIWRALSRRDKMLVENGRLTPCTRPVWDGMWVFGNTFRPAGTVLEKSI
jgi:hypothetical protein